MDETLQQGPIYFFDQPKTKKKSEKEMEPELFGNLISGSTHIHETGSFHRKPGCTEELMERNSALVKNSSAKHVLVPPQTYGPFIFQPTSKNVYTEASQIPSHGPSEVLQPTSLDRYQCLAVTVLHELEDMLNYFSKQKIIVPLGILNILNYSWKDLIEGAWYNKKSYQEPVYKNVNSRRRQASGMSSRLSSTSALTDYETAENITRKSKKTIGFSSGIAKESENPGTSLNKTPVSQEYANDSVSAISFSLSSKSCKEKGWVFQHSDCDLKDLEWKVPYVRAVERLQKAELQISEQQSKMKESGFDKTLILRHYGDGRKETFPKYVKGYRNKKDSSQVSYEKPQLPAIKQTEPGIKKLHYQLMDGSSLIYYPSGNIAVCQSYSDLPGGGLYTNIFSDFPDSALLGTFTPSGNGSVCIPNSNNIVLIYNQKGGMVTNKDGQILRQWKWPGAGKLDEPVIIQQECETHFDILRIISSDGNEKGKRNKSCPKVNLCEGQNTQGSLGVNKYITVRIVGRFAVSLIYKWEHESVRLSLSTLQGVAVPQLESLDQIFTEAKVTSTLAKGFTKTHSKKEEEINTSLKKIVNLSKDSKISGIPEESLSSDFSVMTELKKLRQKIKNILEHWMEYYRIAFEISLPHLHKSSTFLQRGGKKCKTQPACAFLGKNKDYEAALSHNLPPFYSATPTGLTQDMPSESSRAPRLLSSSSKIKQVATAHIGLNKKFSPKLPKTRSSMAQSLAHTTCPVVLQRNMLGEEAKICRCSNHQIPSVTDLEYDHLINNQASSPEQITVVWVTASLGAANYDPRTDEHLEQLYERKNKNRSMPCTQGRLDSFRLLKYDISSADEFTGRCGSLLVKRHNIAPGMVLMYIQGKLLFANYIFNGYSKSAKDLQKQIAITRSSYNRGCYLPTDYRFSLQSYPEHTEATISDDVSRYICYATDRKESSYDFELFNLYREAPCTGIHKHSN